MPGIAVWGDGAVGTGLSVALANAGIEVVLVGPPGSGRGDADLFAEGAVEGKARVRRAESGDDLAVETVLLALKAFDLAAVSGQLPRGSRLLCASNGLGLGRGWKGDWSLVERLVLTYGFELTGPGRARTFPGTVHALAGGSAESVLGNTGLSLETHASMEPLIWAKWLVNSVINPFGALTGAANDSLVSLGLRHSMQKVFDELAPLVPAGLEPGVTGAAGRMLEGLVRTSGNRCSMLQDLERGSRTEIDFLTGYAEELKPGGCPLARLLSDLVRSLSPSPASPS